MINGRSLIGLTHQEAVDVLRNAPRLIQLVVAAKVIIHPSSGYLKIKVHPKLLVSQSKFSGPRKFTLRYQ